MQVVFEDGRSRRECDVRLNNPSATVADLAHALDPAGGHGRALLIEDRQPDPDLTLREAGLHEGALVRFGRPRGGAAWLRLNGDGPGPAGPGPAPRELVVVNGLEAGRRVALAPGTTVVGRARGCDVVVAERSVSRRHAEVELTGDGEVRITDLGSHNGTWIGDDPLVAPTVVGEGTRVRMGALELEVRSPDESDRPFAIDPARQATPAGTMPFNRPPRPALPPPHGAIDAPRPPEKSMAKQPFSLIQVLTPMVFAGTMYLVMDSIMFLAFGLLSPVMALGNFVAGRRRGRKQAKLERARYRKELDQFRQALDDVGAVERERRMTAYPDPVEVIRRAELPSTTLWERRPAHADFLKLRVGLGNALWEPPITRPAAGRKLPDELVETIEEARRLRDAPVLADLSEGGVVGIVGSRPAALAVARSLLCQAAVVHGPADLPVMVLTTAAGADDWDWAKWLPHTRDASGTGRMLSADPELSTRMVEAPLAAARARDSGGRRWAQAGARDQVAGPTRLVVVDDESLTQGRRAPTRNLLRGDAGPVAGIVVAEVADRLPAMVTTVVSLTGRNGRADVIRPQHGDRTEGVLTCGMGEDVARRCAQVLARFEDPELEVAGAGLPPSVRLLPLLELEECTPEAILSRWRSAGVDPSPAGPIGVTADDVFRVDFVTDGPHGLVGGTTGAGKSELLRTLVAGMAAGVDPDHLTFLLVDFKGGSAFDQCARLPHTVGMVTDLDEHLAERALRCLEAELRYREKVLRAAGAGDLSDYLRNGKGTDPLPRLLVMVDEFATLKAELPDFIDSLVGVAQRGRSLGVHMLLATQRPQGAINDNIKANTNLRIALRMQDKRDSNDILDQPDAADLSRTTPGRAYVRLGPDEIVAIQTALSTAARDDGMLAPVEVAPFVYGPRPRRDGGPGPSPAAPTAPPPAPPPATGSGDAGTEGSGVGATADETDLGVLVAAINTAFEQTGRPRPRRPWPDPLPTDLDLDDLIDRALARAGHGRRPDVVPVALADDPDAQSQYPVGWRPGDGNLLLYGIVGSGTTTMLSSLALSLAHLHGPDRLHLYVMDFGAGELEPLAGLPHCGGVAGAGERERQQRIIRMLRAELDRRRDVPAAERAELPMVVTLIDGWGTFAGDYQDLAGQGLLDTMIRVIADGPEVGIHTVITADRPLGISQKVAATVRQRWVFRLANVSDYASVTGMPGRAVPDMVPGHALVAESKLLVHVARPAGGLAAAVAGRQGRVGERVPARLLPAPVRTLPTEVRWEELRTAARLGERPWRVPIGLAEADLRPCSLVAYEGEHVFVGGPSRSGRSSTLLTVAEAVLAAEPGAHVAAVAHRRSPLSRDPRMSEFVGPEDIEEIPRIIATEAPVVLLLLDDVETIDDKRLEALGVSQRENLLVVAAGRSDVLRSSYQHWTRALRRSKLGVLLNPNPDLEGDILGTKLPRRTPVAMTTGRGYVVSSGEATLAQLALPTSVPPTGR